MSQHENSRNQVLSSESGFKQEFCRQLNIPGFNRTPVKPAGKSRNRLEENSATDLSAIEFLAQGDVIHLKLKRILEKDAEKRDFKYPEINRPGAHKYVEMAKFRRRNYWMTDFSEKKSDIALNAHIWGFMQFEVLACINLGKSIQIQCEAVKTRFEMIASSLFDKLKPVKNPFLWQKTKYSEQLVETSNRWKYPANTGPETYSTFSNN